MNDVHCHILPGLDDGSQNMEQTINMARLAVKDGIHTIVATPHYQVDGFRCDASQVCEAVKEVNKELEAQEIALHIQPGMEIHIYPRIVEDLTAGKVLPLGWKGRHVLVELPFHNRIHQATRLFQEICSAGYVPIIAHPERNTYFQKRPELIHSLVLIGAVTQLNAASLAGMYGRGAMECAIELMRCGLAHLLATDAHNSVNRPPQLSVAYEAISRLISRELSECLMHNSQAVVRGEAFGREKPEVPKQRRFFRK